VITCSECGLVFDETAPASRRRHGEFHDDRLRGPLIPRYGVLLARRRRLEARWVRPALRDSRTRLRSLLRVASAANRETAFDGGVYRDPEADHVLLVYRSRRVVAMAVIDWGGPCIKVLWASARQTTVTTRAPWRVCHVWCLPALRQRGVARWMIAAFADRLGIATSDLGWHTPFSPAGAALAASLSREFYWAAR
jgi:hypothetical protein